MTSRSVVELAIRRFLLMSVLAVVVLGFLTVIVSRHIARDEAVRDARMRSAGMAEGIASPLVDEAVRRGDPDAVRRLGRILRNRMADGSVTHINIWDVDGRILWADDPALIGRTYPLPPVIREIAGTGSALVEPDAGGTALPGRQPGDRGLLEVYVGEVGADGDPFIFEAYIPPQRVRADYRAIVTELLPVTLGMLLLLELVSLPLALSLARRIDRANRVRSGILGRSLAAWHEERRRIAQDLHDTVVQDLSACAYALPALLDAIPPGADFDPARERGQQMARMLQADVRTLRTVMVDLAPTALDEQGMAGALEQLADGSEARGVAVRLELDDELPISAAVAGLVYRAVREGLLNVSKHAGTDRATVHVRRRGDRVEVRVEDAGAGLRAAASGVDHAGLRLLGQLVRDVGGVLEVRDRFGGGVELVVDLPTHIDPELDG